MAGRQLKPIVHLNKIKLFFMIENDPPKPVSMENKSTRKKKLHVINDFRNIV